MRLVLYHIIALFFISILMGCASSGTLGGGPEDKIPPKLVLDRSTTQNLTNYRGQEIKLVFDEYIELRNVVKELHVSPPLTYRLQTKVRGKNLFLSFNEKEVLRQDVTYIINMGQSIVDFRAGNVLKNFRYVFSTGDKIDSLSVAGKVIDFNSGEPIENATVMLYNVLEDSVVLKEKPYYLIKTDKKGSFKLENIKKDSFRIYVITDANNNYMYDPYSDGIGFNSEDFFLDSVLEDIELVVSEPNPPFSILRTIENPGRVDILFNKEIKSIPQYQILPPEISVWEKINKDTLKLFYTANVDSFKIQILGLDTIGVIPDRDSMSGNFTLQFSPDTKNIRMGDSIIYLGRTPLVDMQNTDNILVEIRKKITENIIIDSLQSDSIAINKPSYLNERLIYQLSPNFDEGMVFLTADWMPGRYNVTIPSGTFKDVFGRYNDSLEHVINCVFEDELSEIKLKVANLDSTKNYLIEVQFLKGREFNYDVNNKDSIDILFRRIIPAGYEVIIVEDINRNGKWDGPEILGRIQPEPMMKKTFDKPKANWEVEESIIWSKHTYN